MDGIGNLYKDKNWLAWAFTKVSYGNIGYNTAQCDQDYINWSDINASFSSSSDNQLNFACQTTTNIVEVVSSGALWVSSNSTNPYQQLIDHNRCSHGTPLNNLVKSSDLQGF